MGIAVPDAVARLVERALQAADQGGATVPAGHLFTLYLGGWWTKHDESQRIDALKAKLQGAPRRRAENIKRKISSAEMRLEQNSHCCIIDNELRPIALRRIARGWHQAEAARVRNRLASSATRHGIGDALVTEHRTLAAPFVTGIGIDTPLENGFAFLSPYGLPYLPGSAVKGVLRRAAEDLAVSGQAGWSIPAVWRVFGFDANCSWFDASSRYDPDVVSAARGEWRSVYDAWASTVEPQSNPMLAGFAGCVTGAKRRQRAKEDLAKFLQELPENDADRNAIHMRGGLEAWDVIPVPSDDTGMRIDVMTPHHGAYFEGNAPPGTWEDPKPHTFLTLPPGTELTFVLRWNPPAAAPSVRANEWKEQVEAALDHAGKSLGFGAKTAVGYGRLGGEQPEHPAFVFSPPPALSQPTTAQLASMSPEERVGSFDLQAQGAQGLSELLKAIMSVPDGARRRSLYEALRSRAKGPKARVVFGRFDAP